jgi:hypothetical protein
VTRGHPTTFTDAAQAATNKPVWLVALHTGLSSPNDVLRYTTAEADVTFPDAGDTYSRKGFGFGLIELSLDNPSRMQMRIADDGTIRDLGADWIDKRVEVIRIERSATSSSDYAQTDVYLVDSAVPAQGEMVFELATRKQRLELGIPRRLVDYDDFPGVKDAQ